MKDEDILNLNSLISDMRKRATSLKEKNASSGNKKDEKIAEDIFTLLSVEESINRTPKSTIFAIFRFLGYFSDKNNITLYSQMYSKLVEEANREYTLIEENQIEKR